MFPFKKSQKPNLSNPDSGIAASDTSGTIRTLKKDVENFRSGHAKADDTDENENAATIGLPTAQVSQSASPASPPASSNRGESLGGLKPKQGESAPQQTIHDNFPAVGLPAEKKFIQYPPKNTPQDNLSAMPDNPNSIRQTLPDPFGSNPLFQTESPFSEKRDASPQELLESKGKTSRKLAIILSSVLIAAALGGGFYYWWFFFKDRASNDPESNQTSIALNGNDQKKTGDQENQRLRRWKLDSESDKIAAKLAIGKYAQSFISAGQENELAEIKIVTKNDQPVGSKKFEEIFSFQIPNSISGNLTEEYSLFVMKELSEPKMGAAFKLSAQPPATTQTLKGDEGSIAANLASFYLDKNPNFSQSAFDSSKYKNADIRYSTFPGLINVSFDYTILSDKQNSYFIFSTSKNSLRAILDYMSEK